MRQPVRSMLDEKTRGLIPGDRFFFCVAFPGMHGPVVAPTEKFERREIDNKCSAGLERAMELLDYCVLVGD